VTQVTQPPREDPALLFLFAQLRSWSLQTVKGAIAVPGKTEFNVRPLESPSGPARGRAELTVPLPARSSSSTSRAFSAAWVRLSLFVNLHVVQR